MPALRWGTPIGGAFLPFEHWTCLMSRTAFLALAILTATIVFVALKPTLVDSVQTVTGAFEHLPTRAAR